MDFLLTWCNIDDYSICFEEFALGKETDFFSRREETEILIKSQEQLLQLIRAHRETHNENVGLYMAILFDETGQEVDLD